MNIPEDELIRMQKLEIDVAAAENRLNLDAKDEERISHMENV